MTSTSDAVALTSRARIEHLENDLSSLWTIVRNLETKLGGESTEAATATLPHPQSQSQSQSQPQLPPQPPPQSQTDNPRLQDKPSDADDDTDSNASELSPTNPPTHLLQLFDNGLLGSNGQGHDSATPPRHAASMHKIQGSSVLRRLMPSRENMLIITAHASSWLSLYYALIPTINFPKTGDEMLSQYDKLQDSNADPVAVAALLLSVAMTVQQAPDDTTGRAAESIRDASSFIRDVSDSVERIVISDDALAGSLEGIEMTLLFLRL